MMWPASMLPLALVVTAAASPDAQAPRPFEAPADPDVLAYGGNPETGWSLFRAKKCSNCHAVWGQGGDVGPDLGRMRGAGYVSAGQLAGTMWNHVPRMWKAMEERHIQVTEISAEEMSHLFAFLLFIRYIDEPGDAGEGHRVLMRHQCPTCHSIAGEGGVRGPDLQKWARFVNPIVWGQNMWRHASGMASQMHALGIVWPRFDARDLVNIVAYVRSRGGGEYKEYLEPAAPTRGRSLFETRGCSTCHAFGRRRSGPDLEAADLPESLAGVAAQMWNHAPAMQKAIKANGAETISIEAQEMADVISYVLTRRYFSSKGDPATGVKLFALKGCLSCHKLGEYGGKVGPELTEIRGSASPVFMAYVMWRYGPHMLAEMTKRGIPWPTFHAGEMEHLIAFLQQE